MKVLPLSFFDSSNDSNFKTATCNSKTKGLKELGLNTSFYKRNTEVTTVFRIVMLHTTKGRRWITYKNANCFNSNGCPQPNIIKFCPWKKLKMCFLGERNPTRKHFLCCVLFVLFFPTSFSNTLAASTTAFSILEFAMQPFLF